MYSARDVFIDPPGPEIARTLPRGTPPSRNGARRAPKGGGRSAAGGGRAVAAGSPAPCPLSRRPSSRSSRSSPSNSPGALETSPGFEVWTHSTPTPSAIPVAYMETRGVNLFPVSPRIRLPGGSGCRVRIKGKWRRRTLKYPGMPIGPRRDTHGRQDKIRAGSCGHTHGGRPDAGDQELDRPDGHEGGRGPGHGPARPELLRLFRTDHRQRPGARGPGRLLYARRLGHPDDGEGRDDPLRRPGVADPLLDVPERENHGTGRGPEGEGRGREDGLDLRRYPGRLLGDRDASREARGAEVASAERELQDAPVAAHQVDGEGMRHRHASVAEPEGLIELLNAPEGLRPDLVREDRVIRLAADGERQGQAERVRLVPRQDGGESGQGLPVERMEVPFPGAACRFRLAEGLGEALLLDDEARVHAAKLEGDPAVERARAVHVCLSNRLD